jgi:hypothetical protein
MKSALIAAAVALLAGSAAAQSYPRCTHPGQDRCIQTGRSMGRMHAPHGRAKGWQGHHRRGHARAHGHHR